MLGKFGAWAVAASLVVSATALAAGNADRGALPEGKAAGIKQAESLGGITTVELLGAAGVLGGALLLATGNNHGSVANTCPLAGCTSPPPPVTTTTTPATTTTTP